MKPKQSLVDMAEEIGPLEVTVLATTSNEEPQMTPYLQRLRKLSENILGMPGDAEVIESDYRFLLLVEDRLDRLEGVAEAARSLAVTWGEGIELGFLEPLGTDEQAVVAALAALDSEEPSNILTGDDAARLQEQVERTCDPAEMRRRVDAARQQLAELSAGKVVTIKKDSDGP